ncbi:NADP-dependent malic enzyme [Hibiscus syriacus]|uniref:Malic enzyme n=1 Tax=Hibiscus syriacus TaxID=106335 RepID=A0A6A2ZXX2_HIBSY|nr:NADP-dependent malic enzyme [Hibiscus syriacus]
MISLHRSCFLNNTGISGSSSPLSYKLNKLPPASVKVTALGPNKDRNSSVLVENSNPLKEIKEDDNSSVADVDPTSTVAGEDAELSYDDAAAADDQLVTPWSFSVASGYSLLRDPHHNKGLAFNEKERDAYYLRGLLPPTVISQDLQVIYLAFHQVKKMMHSIRQYQVPLQKYMAMMDLQELNERLFYKLLINNVEELLPVVYTPTVGKACQKYGSIFRRPQGLFISLKEKGKIREVLRNWPQRNIQIIVVTDGERILGLGDLGCQGMGIPIGKLSLYTALGGVRPSTCLPVTIDVGTNNEKLLNDEFYIGLRQRRATGQEYAELMHEFMTAVKQTYGEKVLIQFEDFANHNAFDLLAKYSTTHLVFNDDIQGTASVVLAGAVAALKVVGGTLADHRFLFLGAGEAGTGIAELIALEISKQTNMPLKEARKKISLVDSKGLIVKSRMDTLQHFKKPWAHDHEPVKNLIDGVNGIKPTVLIGTSGVGRTFTKEVIEAMAALNEKPIIFSLSNPTSQSECTAEEAYTWSQGRAIFASGSPFDPVEYNGRVFVTGQANNANIFPGLGLGLIMSGAIRVHDDMLLAASEALAAQVTRELRQGTDLPTIQKYKKDFSSYCSRCLGTRQPRPHNLVKYAENCMYDPAYQSYSPHPDLSHYNGLMFDYSRNNKKNEALNLILAGRQVHCQCLKLGLPEDVRVGTYLFDMYMRTENVKDEWNERASFGIVLAMQMEGIKPNPYIFAIVIRALKDGFSCDPRIETVLMVAYSSAVKTLEKYTMVRRGTSAVSSWPRDIRVRGLARDSPEVCNVKDAHSGQKIPSKKVLTGKSLCYAYANYYSNRS